jgi:hypothetical protein
MTKDEIAVNAIRKAADRVNELRAGVDEGHIPMITYLRRLERKLREEAQELESRCRRESGER